MAIQNGSLLSRLNPLIPLKNHHACWLKLSFWIWEYCFYLVPACFVPLHHWSSCRCSIRHVHLWVPCDQPQRGQTMVPYLRERNWWTWLGYCYGYTWSNTIFRVGKHHCLQRWVNSSHCHSIWQSSFSHGFAHSCSQHLSPTLERQRPPQISFPKSIGCWLRCWEILWNFSEVFS